MQWIPSDDGSFGVVSRNIIRELQKRRTAIPWVGGVFAQLDGPDLPPGWRFLLFFVWELTAIHRGRFQRLQNIHRIVGISRHVVHILERYGIEAVPGQLGVDVEQYRPLPHLKPAKPFTFGSVIAANSRSGLDVLLEGFKLAFGSSKDVLLRIKLYSRPEPKLVDYIHSYGIHVEVLDHFWDWTEEQMCEFYNSLNCFVYPTRTTAWGMPLSEACACEVPCIVTDYSAPPEFIDPEIGWLIPAQEVEVDWDYCRKMHVEHGWVHHWPETGYVNGPPRWGDPDVEALAGLLQQAAQNPDWVMQKGKLARRKMMEHYTWSHALDRILQAIELPEALNVA